MLTSLSRNSFYRLARTVLWFLVLVGLPLTSFPLLSRLTGAIVAPFSFIPLVVLLVVWLVPFVLEKGKLPAEMVPFFYFVLVAIAVSGLAFFLNGFYDLGQDFFGQTLRAFITLAIGMSFYLVFATYPQDEKHLRQALIFVYIGGVLLIAWTFVEAFLIRKYGIVRDMPEWVTRFRSALVTQSPNIYYSNQIGRAHV